VTLTRLICSGKRMVRHAFPICTLVLKDRANECRASDRVLSLAEHKRRALVKKLAIKVVIG